MTITAPLMMPPPGWWLTTPDRPGTTSQARPYPGTPAVALTGSPGPPMSGSSQAAAHRPRYPRRDELARVAARQRGLFTREQAHTCGYSTYELRRRLADRRWIPVLGRVLAPDGTSITATLLDRAALLCLPGAILAGASAARAHHLPVPDPGQHLIIPERVRALPGTRLWHERLSPVDLSTVDGVVVTSVARTVFDCVRTLPEHHATELLALAIGHRWITWPDFTRRARAVLTTRKPLAGARLAALAGITAEPEPNPEPGLPGRPRRWPRSHAHAGSGDRAAFQAGPVCVGGDTDPATASRDQP